MNTRDAMGLLAEEWGWSISESGYPGALGYRRGDAWIDVTYDRIGRIRDISRYRPTFRYWSPRTTGKAEILREWLTVHE